MKLYPIETGNLKLDGGAMFGVVPKAMWQKAYPCDENNYGNFALRSLLIIDGDRKILIDNGIGEKQDEKWLRYYYLNGDATLENSLAEVGESHHTITDVILTHMHFDHCGGSVKYNNDKTGYELAFPNATYWTSKKQYEWATNPNRREKPSFLKENIMPLKESGKLNLLEEEGEHIPNIDFKFYNGHTDGQVIPYINIDGKKVAFMADLLPTAAHMPMPWIAGYDTRPLISLQDKERLFADALKNNIILFFQHDLYNEACTIHDTPKGVRVLKKGKLREFI